MGPWADYRVTITPSVALTARAMARAGRAPADIARRLGLTDYLAQLFCDAQVNEAAPAPPDESTHFGNATTPPPVLEEHESWVEPQNCPACQARIRIVPCRACRARNTPRVRPPIRDG